MKLSTTIIYPPKALLPQNDASVFLGDNGYETSPNTLAKLRCVGGGPQFRRFGRKILYDPDHLLNWAVSKTSKPLSSTSSK
jgi:hypothetical protein